jgi:hypothetical protein
MTGEKMTIPAIKAAMRNDFGDQNVIWFTLHAARELVVLS